MTILSKRTRPVNPSEPDCITMLEAQRRRVERRASNAYVTTPIDAVSTLRLCNRVVADLRSLGLSAPPSLRSLRLRCLRALAFGPDHLSFRTDELGALLSAIVAELSATFHCEPTRASQTPRVTAPRARACRATAT
jgi:hypothetical protein